jgi:hypothetical protein
MKISHGSKTPTSEPSEVGVTRQLRSVAREAVEVLRRIPEGIPETIRQELICTRELKDTVRILGEEDGYPIT